MIYQISNIKYQNDNLKFKIFKRFWTLICNFDFCILIFAFFMVFGFWIYNVFAQDRIVAVVNNEIITQKDLEDFTNFMKLETSREYPKEDLLERLIEDRLILQAAYKENLKVDRNRINTRIEQIKERHKSIEEFKNVLLNQGLSLADLELKIKEQILMYDIIEKKIRSKISVSPQEVTNYYLRYYTEFIEPEKRKVSSLEIEDQEMAKRIKEEFSNLKNFEEISLKYSLEIRGLGWVNRKQMREEISEVVFRLKRGEFSPLMSLDGKYYIFKVEEISEEKKMSLLDVQEDIYNLLFEEKMKMSLEEWLKELRKNAFIKVSLE